MSKESATAICHVCNEECVFFGILECNHAVCGKCAIRIRVVCKSQECPVCRHVSTKIAIVNEKKPFNCFDISSFLHSEDYDLLFESTACQKYFADLTRCSCTICHYQANTMSALNRHLNNEHQRFFCDLCLHNLNHFPAEFHIYDQEELAKHRKWKPDEPNKGHPQCQFCLTRFYDVDVWYSHLRKQHFMCHICENIPTLERFHQERTVYGDYQDLYYHFKEKHYVCEDGLCSQEQFTNVYSNDADLKAHKVAVHSSIMDKFTQRETRRLDIDFTARRDRVPFRGGARGGNGRGGAQRNEDDSYKNGGVTLARGVEEHGLLDNANRNRQDSYSENPEDFPTLQGQTVKGFQRPKPTEEPEEEYPCLQPSSDQRQNVRQVRPNDKWQTNASSKPSAPAAKNTKVINNPLMQNQSWGSRVSGPNSSTDDFPALAPSNVNPIMNNSSWKPPAKTPSVRKQNQPAQQSFSATDKKDFPSLPSSGHGATAAQSLLWNPVNAKIGVSNISSKPVTHNNKVESQSGKSSSVKHTTRVQPSNRDRDHSPPAAIPPEPTEVFAPAPTVSLVKSRDINSDTNNKNLPGFNLKEQTDDFPSLPKGAKPKPQSVWCQQSSKKPKAKVNNNPTSLVDDFPDLSGNNFAVLADAGSWVDTSATVQSAPQQQAFAVTKSDFPSLSGNSVQTAPAVWKKDGNSLTASQTYSSTPLSSSNNIPIHTTQSNKNKKKNKAQKSNGVHVSNVFNEKEFLSQREPVPDSSLPIDPKLTSSSWLELLAPDQIKPSVTHTFQKLTDHEDREDRIWSSLGSQMTQDSFRKFGQASVSYIQNEDYSAKQFVTDLTNLIGKTNLHVILPDLLTTMPSIDKQTELYNILGEQESSMLKPCDTCLQIIPVSASSTLHSCLTLQ